MQVQSITESHDELGDALQRIIGDRMLVAAAKPNRMIGELHEDQTKRIVITAMWKEGYWRAEGAN